MLVTPLGNIKVYVNNEGVDFTAIKLVNDLHFPNSDIKGRFLIQYEYRNDYKHQEITCCIPSLNVEGVIESGERLEAISFYKKDIKLTIGVDWEFTDYPEYIDFSGDYLNNGIQYVTFHNTADRKFSFGVCWIQPCTEENDIQTWFGADPSFM
ncbi:hypothetical protein [Ureibacillus sinduriensis]|uniref:hypothetical protein n=1 Tax=Ureibacillus sinduriensis TaxID=561440 RepID=UPI00068FD26A|nr:hypothetical protein [Ureibacillus sinduriensis]